VEEKGSPQGKFQEKRGEKAVPTKNAFRQLLFPTKCKGGGKKKRRIEIGKFFHATLGIILFWGGGKREILIVKVSSGMPSANEGGECGE